MATQSSILAWKIPWTKEPGRLQCMGSQRVRHRPTERLNNSNKALTQRVWVWLLSRLRRTGFLEAQKPGTSIGEGEGVGASEHRGQGAELWGPLGISQFSFSLTFSHLAKTTKGSLERIMDQLTEGKEVT